MLCLKNAMFHLKIKLIMKMYSPEYFQIKVFFFVVF